MATHVSRHAASRMAQRNIQPSDLSLVLRFGRVEYRAGAEFYFLGRRDIPDGMELTLERLIGATVVVTHGQIATVYRNRRALRAIRRKPKRPLA
jgi:hypothetical protein